jgi:LPS sulfotransferase NodH
MAGSLQLCNALGATGAMPTPQRYFNPPQVKMRSHSWQVSRLEGKFPVRFLTAVGAAGMDDNGLFAACLHWSHLRWVVRIAREALASTDDDEPRSDAGVLDQWFPHPRYVHIYCSDTARQALRWYSVLHDARRAGAAARVQEPDFQEVRWLETLIERHNRGWSAYFRIHAIDALMIEFEEFRAQPQATTAGIVSALGLTASSTPTASPWPDTPVEGRSELWLDRYLKMRNRLSRTVGVRRKSR